MSKKKGVSAEEKKQRMLDLFYEKKDFFQLKELEKLAPKEKGIVAQSVKDVVQNLVDDNLVNSEKIGTSIYFWAFPSKATYSNKKKLVEIEEKVETAKKAKKKHEEDINLAKVGREDSPGRNEILQVYNELLKENENLLKEIKKHKDFDAEALENMKKDIKELVYQVNKATQNLFAFISWCKSRFVVEEETLFKQFGVPQDIDYLDDSE